LGCDFPARRLSIRENDSWNEVWGAGRSMR
jgi:hypothetical protein